MHFKRMGVRKGVADYLAFTRGIRAAIELKGEDGDQSVEQIKFERDWKATGGTYVLVRTLEEFQAYVETLVLFGG